MYTDKPMGNDYQVIAKVQVIELIEPFKFKNAAGEEMEPPVSFIAMANVIESVRGIENGQTIRLVVEASSCNTPFFLNESGYIAAKSLVFSNGQMIAFIKE